MTQELVPWTGAQKRRFLTGYGIALAAVVVLVIVVFAKYPDSTERTLRWAGEGMLLVGMAMMAYVLVIRSRSRAK